jgi:hypothetical protein
MSFELHKHAIFDATDIELTKWVSIAVAECRRRALISRGYSTVAINLGKNAETNAALKTAGMPHTGFDPAEVQ